MRTRKPSEYLIEHGCSAEVQEQMWLDKDVSLVPKNSDNRVFPLTKPEFRVNF